MRAGDAKPVPELGRAEGVERLPNTISVAFPGVSALEVADRAEGLAIASGSACHAGKPHVSATLKAMGIPDDLALSTLRLSVGSPTSLDDAERATAILARTIAALRG